MGLCSSSPEASKNSELNKELKDSKKVDSGIKKLLFLGSGGSGKSTLFKQLRTIHGEGFSEHDRKFFITHIHAQIIEQMKLALEAIEFSAEEELEKKMGDDYERPDDFNAFEKLSKEAQESALHLQSIGNNAKLTHRIGSDCKVLWKEDAVKKMYDERAVTKIDDSTNYFWDHIDDVLASDYVPNEMEILMARFRTTGVIQQKFSVEKTNFHVFDVGGQKSERKKWIHHFDNVTAVIFVASLSCFDQIMFEDDGNQMVDSLQEFENIANNHYFKDTSIILFLNKRDLFLEKIETKSIKVCESFSSFDGDEKSFEETTDYIKDVFLSRYKQESDKSIFVHCTCATDKNNVEKVFNDVQHIVIQSALVNAGVMGDAFEVD